MDAAAATPSVEKSKSERDTATPSPQLFLQKSSSSSSLLLPENKKDSPTKSNRLRKSTSSGSLRKSPRGSRSSTPVAPATESVEKSNSERDTATPSPQVSLQKSSSSSSLLLPENKKDSPTKSNRLKRSTSSGSLRKSPRGSRSSTPVAPTITTTPESPVQDAAKILDSLKVAEEEKIQAEKQQRETSTSPVAQKQAPLMNPSPTDTPSPDETTPTRPQRRSSPTTKMLSEEETMQQLERICASPMSTDGSARDTSIETDVSDTKEEPLKPQETPPKLLSSSNKKASLQWHEGPQTSSRVLPAREPSKLLPSPPSMRVRPATREEEQTDTQDSTASTEVVAVFNANTSEGKSMVRALAKSGSQVVAIVRVFTSRNTKSLLKLGKNVVVKVADSHDKAALSKAVQGAHRAFMCTTYWDRFDSALEEKQALIVLEACASQNVQHLVLSSFEDTKVLKQKGLKSQIVPRKDGTITPNFDGMKSLHQAAKERNVMLTHMVTSYLDQEHSKKSLCVIVGENGNVLVNSHVPTEEKNQLTPTVE